MSSKIPYKEFLADTAALLYLYSLQSRDLLVLILSKFKIHVSAISLAEFFSFIYYKQHEYDIVSRFYGFTSKTHIIEPIDAPTALRASMIINDLIKHGQVFDLVDVFNVAVASAKNIPILSIDTERYQQYSKYGVTSLDVRDLVSDFEVYLEKAGSENHFPS
jgi:predicted nucleic acid-binding protein